MGRLLEIANGVSARIAGGDYGSAGPAGGLEPRVAFRPNLALADLGDGLDIVVIAHADEIVSANRATNEHTLSVDVALRQRVPGPPDDVAVVDALAGLLELIADQLDRFNPPLFENQLIAAWMGGTLKVPYSSDALQDKNMFLGVLALRYKLLRAPGGVGAGGGG